MARSTDLVPADTEVLAASPVPGQRQSQPAKAPPPPPRRPRHGLARLPAKARAHLDDPLLRNAYALMMNTAATPIESNPKPMSNSWANAVCPAATHT